uniref:Non-specific serine/threonine protein kinase n=1 Tax=Hymenolepis diminuta TaxID=6216 RepID=A0A158QE53_HYMDI
LCCAHRCPDNCLDTFDILCEPSGNRDISMSDIACLLISSWTKFLQKILSASESSNVEVVSSLLEEFRTNCCTFRKYTDLCLRLDFMKHEDLREFTLLCMDPDSVPGRQNRIPPNVIPSSTKSFFNMVAEGAGKAFNAVLSVGEQIIGGGLDEIDYMEADLLARRTRNVVAQLTQRFLSSMLISAIERADFPIIHILLDFGFRLQAVSRPSMCLPKEVDISTVVKRKNDVETRRNPIDWRLDTPGGPDWLLTALRTTEDTPILAAIRKNMFQEDVFDRLLKEGMHLLMLSGGGGILPVHLMAALGRIEMLSAVLKSNNPSLDVTDDCGLTALLISAFYGHIDCVSVILEYSCDEMTEIATSQASDVPYEEGEGEQEHQQKPDRSLSNSFSSICLVNVSKSAPMNWYFRRDGSNTLVIGAMRRAVGKHFIAASNVDLLECLLTYVKEDSEVYGGWVSKAPLTQTNGDLRSELVVEEKQLLANLDSVELLCTPVGLACCLDDIKCADQSLTSDILRLLSTIQNRKSSSLNPLLHYLLDRQRFHLVGGILYQQKCGGNRSIIDWSNRLICKYLSAESRDTDVFSTLVSDWLSWSPLDTITKINLSNNTLYCLPMCLFTQLPSLEELDLSRNSITGLPSRSQLEEYAKALGITILAPNLTRLDLSNNLLQTVPPWIFGTTASTKSKPIFAPRLSTLRLCDNKLRSVPRQMWLAKRLQCLDLSANLIVELPRATVEEILGAASFRLESSAESDLITKRGISCLPQIPNGVKVMTFLKSDKDLAIPSSSASANNLVAENCHRWTGGLLHLWLQRNRLIHLPLSELPLNTRRQSLTTINDSRKSSQEVCSGNVGLSLLAPALTSLDVSGNQLSGPLPPPSRFPSKLVHLDLSNNQISSVGLLYDGKRKESIIENSPDDDRKLSSPPVSDGQFRRLLHLNLRNNKISTFNPISSLSGGSGLSDTYLWFPELSSLDLSGNIELKSLSSAVCRLEKLSSLELDGCSGLTELPPDLWRLSKLKSLTLFNTPAYGKLVRDIRAEEVIQQNYSRQRQKLQQQQRRKSSRGQGLNTPLSSIPSSKSADMPILNTKTILEHLKSLSKSSKPYNKVRLMLIGSRGVGKTSLLKALLHCEDQDANIPESESHSASLTITPLRITRKCPSDRPRSEWTESVEFSVWDFKTPSGTEDEVGSVLSAVQQFLMSKSTIYVVVWKSTDAPDGLHILARHLVDIQTRASNAPVVLVTTHNDLPSCMASDVSEIIDRCFLRSSDPSAMGFSQQIVGHFRVNPTDLNDCNNLNEIHQIATSVYSAANFLKPPFRKPLIGTKYEPNRQRLLSYSVPLVYHDLEYIIRNLANDLRVAGIPPIVSLEDFVQVLQFGFRNALIGHFLLRLESEEEILSALTFLHEAGHLLYFPNLSRAIVLDPLWLCDLLLRLLISDTGVQSIRAGVLNLSRLKELLTSTETPNVSGESENSADIDRLMCRFRHLEVSFALTYLVGLLGKFELAAPLDSQHLLVPALLPMRKLADFDSKFSNVPNRQIRITPLNNVDTSQREAGMEGFLKDSDPLDCSVYTLPRGNRSKKSVKSRLPPPIAEDSSESSISSTESPNAPSRRPSIFSKLASNLVPKAFRGQKHKVIEISTSSPSMFFDRSDKMRQAAVRRRGPSIQGQLQVPAWIRQAAPSAHEVLRVYALSYVPTGFWTRLITRLLTDSDLNGICGRLYNLSTVAPELRASLLSLEKDPSSTETLQCGWSLSRMGIQLTLAGGALPVFTLEQVGNRVSFATASIEETEVAMEASESIGLRDFCTSEISLENGDSILVDEKSALGGLDETDFKTWSLYLMRFPTGCAEEFRERLRSVEVEQVEASGLSVEVFDDFAKYCLIQLHMPSFSIHWPDYRNFSKPVDENCASSCSLHPDRRILTQILTKIVHHIDCLLEDWYPDLGTRFNQSNNGEYLVHRVIPCTDCVKDASSRLSQTEDLRDAVSILDNVLSGESNHGSDLESDLAKEFANPSNIVYGILVEELVHWLLTPARKQESLDQNSSGEIIQCPVHSHTTCNGISAPDLLFDDVRTEMKIAGSKVTLEKFLGRGAFGSVFAGSVVFSSAPISSNPVPSDSLLNLVIPVGVKICSPINPMEIDIRLCDWQPFTDEGESEGDSKVAFPDSRTSKTGTSDLGVALALYKQEKRRWSFQPVESCYTAYQELRSELAVLMRVGDDAPISIYNYSSGCFSAPHDSSTLQRSHSSIRSSRRGTLKRSSAKSFNRPKLFSNVRGSEGRRVGKHLLTCLGVVSPRPLTLLLPLAPKGSLSDWMEEMKSSYEVEGVYSVHQSTLTSIVHQVSTAIAYLHQVRIVYRDLKPDNILVWRMPPPITLSSNMFAPGTLRDSYPVRSNNFTSEVHVVLSDFGVSRWRASLDGCRGYVGTPGFMAPEVLASLGEETYTHKVDIYGLGILMASIATFQLPYHGFTNLRFQLNQHILSGGRPDIPAKIKAHCSLPYLDLMSLCWSQEPQHRPEASSIVKVTQNALPSPQLSISTSDVLLECGYRRCFRQVRLPMTVDTEFGQIHSVIRVDAVEVVTCAVIDLEDHIWIGGYSSQTDSGDLDISGDAFFSRSTSSDRIGRLFVLTENENAFHCVLVCSWCPRHEDCDHLPKPAPLPLNLHDGGYPVAMTMDSGDRLWCVDSVGRLMIFSISTLSLLASISLLKGYSSPIDGDCICMFPVDDCTMVLSFSTGWICSVHLTPESPDSASAILMPWSLNTLRQNRRVKQPPGSCLYLCGARVSERQVKDFKMKGHYLLISFIWLGGTSDNLTEFQRLPNTESWQQTSAWKASISTNSETVPLSLTKKKPSAVPHSCGRLCDKSPTVTCITTSWSGGGDEGYSQRVWTYSYPVSSIGSVEQLLWTAEHGILLAGTSRGALLKIIWPIYDDQTSTNSDVDDENFSDLSSLSPGRSAFNRPITARVLRLHSGPAERCFNLLSEHRSLGWGFVHPLHRCLEDAARSDIANYECGYFLVSLLPEDDDFNLGCDIKD